VDKHGWRGLRWRGCFGVMGKMGLKGFVLMGWG
jgi:hypothetical protein